MLSVVTARTAQTAAPLLAEAPPLSPEPSQDVPILHEGTETISHMIRRSGQRPLRIRGSLIAEATGWAIGSQAWHEVSLYRTSNGDLALALKVFKKSPTEKDVFHGRVFTAMDDLVAWLEQYDPTADLSVNIDITDTGASALELTFRAVALRQRMEDIRRDWGALLGELLYQLGVHD